MNENFLAASLLFLGTGASLGVPVIGCHCPVCHSSNPRNKRLRTAALIKIDSQKILIDCGPDFRYQALKNSIEKIDGLILTHSHYDHIAALDELRVFTIRGHSSIPTLSSLHTFDEVKIRFPYFATHPENKLVTQLEWQLLHQNAGSVNFLNLLTHFFSYTQGPTPVLGFRWGDLAYITDIKEFSSDIYAKFNGVKNLVVSALRMTPSPFHLSIDEAIEFGAKIGAKNIWLTHISHEVEYDKISSYLPEHVHLAYDGLEIPFFAEITHE